ncbi:MAG TPA: glycoside hydrolase family 3 N-terminal domain-containing protein, partial [Propionibacteriaceae bacterium]|nr:glycoside hydrolase family 3 N-terminal domain-containing protein [Propionibacteriaceae bacterium]
MTALPYQDPTKTAEERAADLLGRMTLEEKAGQVSQYFYFGSFGQVPEGMDLSQLPPEALMFIQQPSMVEAELKKGAVGSLLFVRDAASANRLQKMALEGNRLGIPLIFGFDVIHGFRTILPVPIAMAASWDPATIERGQAVAAREARAVGIHWTFAPMVDLARDARWGRIIEGAGEDPVLGAAVCAAQVRGFQGAWTSENVISGPKHYAGYGAALGGRDYDDADISDSELYNLYFPPFKGGIDAGAGNIMSAYMDLNGVPASGNRWLLTEVLRGELGFEGFVVSDANAVRSLETQHFAKDLTDAGARAMNAGLDMEMCMMDAAYSRLPQAVADGLVDEATIDQSVRRILEAKFRMGLFENPYVDESASADVLGRTDHREVAREAAEKTIVLLKNEGGALPLNAAVLKKIAVVGQLAESQRDVLGPWVFDQDTAESVSLLEGIRAWDEGIAVDFA